MNKLIIIGNLTRDPKLRTVNTAKGQVSVCDFTVAVNRKNKDSGADYFEVTAWRGLADLCSKWLIKGKKVSVTGSVSADAYTAKDGSARGVLAVNADDVEFLSPANETAAEKPAPAQKVQNAPAYSEIETDDLPF